MAMEHRLTRFFAERPTRGERVLYWMQASVRIRDNLALAWAQKEAHERGLPLEVLFCLDPQDTQANARSVALVLDGLFDVAQGLAALGLNLTVALSPSEPAVLAAGAKAAITVFDRGYLPVARRQRREIALGLPCPVVVAEDNVAVPVETVSGKEEWAASTLRPKLMRLASLEPFLPQPVPGLALSRSERLREDLSQAGIATWEGDPSRSWLARFSFTEEVEPVDLRGGEKAAWARWEGFRDRGLGEYNDARNDPNLEGQSGLGPALHHGQISPVSLMEDLKRRGLWQEPNSYRRAGEDSVSKFLDEVLVRRELSINYVVYNDEHATWNGLPDWARKTLRAHQNDPRTAVYRRQDWEAGRTHDPVWNAVQYQLTSTGRIPGYLRMYWGKKILEWSADPAQAFLDALYLNNKYALDGGDPNSYAGVAWCFGKHDRPWGERAVYGLVRCMTAGGLAKKFHLNDYVRRFTPPS